MMRWTGVIIGQAYWSSDKKSPGGTSPDLGESGTSNGEVGEAVDDIDGWKWARLCLVAKTQP